MKNGSWNVGYCLQESITHSRISQYWFLQYIFGQLIHDKNYKYLPLSLLLPSYSHSQLLSGWNIPFRRSIAISSVIWFEEPIFSDNSIAAAQPDESIGCLEIHHSFFIFLLMCTYASASSAIMDPRRAKEVSLEVIFIGYRRRKKMIGCKIVYHP